MDSQWVVIKGHASDKVLWDIKDPAELLNQMKALPTSDRGPEDLDVLMKKKSF
jgi:hypothetical protein